MEILVPLGVWAVWRVMSGFCDDILEEELYLEVWVNLVRYGVEVCWVLFNPRSNWNIKETFNALGTQEALNKRSGGVVSGYDEYD